MGVGFEPVGHRMRSMLKEHGFTLVELLVTTAALAVVLAVVNTVFFSSNRMYAKTNERASIQMDSRLGMSIMVRELRHAGCDPREVGVVGIVRAAADSLHIRADTDANGAIQTAEPSEDITYLYDPNLQSIFRDPGTGPQLLVPNVTNMTLTYLDAAGAVLGPLPLTANLAARVRSIAVAITTRARDVGEITLTTTIALRNP
jgi:prepilin-type N-terminal cleavage/methylation domain-containing protein